MTTQLPPWSFSMLESFDQCAKKALHKYILKEKEPESEQQRYGNAVHKALELRLKGTPLPEQMARFEPFALSVINQCQKGMKLYTELKMGVDRHFLPCGFFDKEVWGRVASDVVLKQDSRAMVFDWKTGKKREKELQVLVNALFIFIHFPMVDHVTGINLWLESNEIGTPYQFRREDAPRLWQQVLAMIQKMEKALASMNWPAQPSGLCGWCPVTTCEHNRK